MMFPLFFEPFITLLFPSFGNRKDCPTIFDALVTKITTILFYFFFVHKSTTKVHTAPAVLEWWMLCSLKSLTAVSVCVIGSNYHYLPIVDSINFLIISWTSWFNFRVKGLFCSPTKCYMETNKWILHSAKGLITLSRFKWMILCSNEVKSYLSF